MPHIIWCGNKEEWVKAGRRKTCAIPLPHQPIKCISAENPVVVGVGVFVEG